MVKGRWPGWRGKAAHSPPTFLASQAVCSKKGLVWNMGAPTKPFFCEVALKGHWTAESAGQGSLVVSTPIGVGFLTPGAHLAEV